jgi:pimeloyl-ACP methyl ester carboxylesterase
MNFNTSGQPAIGHQRDWIWRGWQTRYTFMRGMTPASEACPPAANHTLPILFLHGFGAAIGHWRHNLPVISQHYPVYALDLLGFGVSVKPQTNYTIALRVAQVYDFWQTFIQQPVVLVGNSLGSLVSMVTAATHPDMVAGLIMLNLPDASVLERSPPGWIQQMSRLLGRVGHPAIALLQTLLLSPPIFDPFFHLIRQPVVIRYCLKQAYVNPQAVDDELVELICRPPRDRGAARALVSMTRSSLGTTATSARVVLPHLEMPLLLIWGRQDRLVPPYLAPLFMQCNPRLKLVELDNAGHCPQDECPEQVNSLILEWISAWHSNF